MATIKTLAGRLWRDPFIHLPAQSSEKAVKELISELESFNRPEATIKVDKGITGIKVTFEPIDNARPYGKTTRKFYVQPAIENFIHKEFERVSG